MVLLYFRFTVRLGYNDHIRWWYSKQSLYNYLVPNGFFTIYIFMVKTMSRLLRTKINDPPVDFIKTEFHCALQFCIQIPKIGNSLSSDLLFTFFFIIFLFSAFPHQIVTLRPSANITETISLPKCGKKSSFDQQRFHLNSILITLCRCKK